MRKRKKLRIHSKKNSLHKRITLLVSFATIITFLLFLVSTIGANQSKKSVLGAAVSQFAMLINDGGGGSAPSPTTNPYTCSTQAVGAGCYKYECPSNMHNIAGYCQVIDSECCAPGAPSPTPTSAPGLILLDYTITLTPTPVLIAPPAGKSPQNTLLNGGTGSHKSYTPLGNFGNFGGTGSTTGEGGRVVGGPTATPIPTETQGIMQYLNDQFTTPTPTPSGDCNLTDSNGNSITISQGQQCPNSPYLCSQGYCAGLCNNNPSGCFGGSGQCQSNGLCESLPTAVPTQGYTQTTPIPTATPIPQQQFQQQSQFTPPPQVPNTPIPATQNTSQTTNQATSQPNIFQSFFNTIPFFQKPPQSNQPTQSGGATPTPGPLLQGTAGLTGGQVQQEIQVEVTIKNGKLTIVARRADGASVTLSDTATQRLLQLMSLGDLPAIMTNGGSSFIIRTGNTEAVTSLPTSINLPFGTIIVTGPDGEDKQLALMPSDAVQAALQSQELNKVDRKQSLWDYILHGASSQKLDTLVYITTLQNGVISYAVPGTITKRFIASFPIDISKTVYISPDNGKVVQITQNPISSALDKISVPYITSTMP